MPPVSGSQWRRSSARFVGRRARLRGALRSAGDWLSLSGRRDADATFAPPFRLPLPFSTERDPLDTPTPTRMPLLSCSAGIACALYPRLPNSLSLPLPPSLCVFLSLSLSLATNGVHLSGVEHKVADRLSPTLPPDAIRYIPWRIVQEGWRMME